jgi:hypothetical protein
MRKPTLFQIRHPGRTLWECVDAGEVVLRWCFAEHVVTAQKSAGGDWICEECGVSHNAILKCNKSQFGNEVQQ